MKLKTLSKSQIEALVYTYEGYIVETKHFCRAIRPNGMVSKIQYRTLKKLHEAGMLEVKEENYKKYYVRTKIAEEYMINNHQDKIKMFIL